MADLKATTIYNYGDRGFDQTELSKITAADDIQIGDFLIYSSASTGVEKMAAATDDATFVGVSLVKSADADGPSKIVIAQKCIIEAPMTSGTYYFGQGLKFKTDGTLEDHGSSPANTIAWAMEEGTTVTSLKVLVDVRKLNNKLFEESA